MKILNNPIATDDYGNNVYLCQYTKKPVSTDKSIMLGSVMPSVKGTYVCSPDAKDARKQSKANFDEMDANCNTCKNLMRVQHEKRRDGCLEGVCTLNNVRMKFHPDDWMGNKCWEKR